MDRMASLARSMGSIGEIALRRSAGKIEATVEKELATLVRNGPRNLAKIVVEAMAQVVEDLGEAGTDGGPELLLGGAPRGALERLRMVANPQNAEGAAEALEVVGDLMGKSPALKRVGGQALAELQDAGVLGDSLMAQVLEWLVVAAVTGVVVARAASGDLQLRAGPLSLSVDRVGNYNAQISLVNSSWIAKRLKLGVLGKRGRLHTAGASMSFRLPSPPSTELSLSPDLDWSRSGGAAIGLSGSMKLPVARSSLTVSPYASMDLRSEGAREAGLTLQARFGATARPGEAPGLPSDGPVALIAALLLGLAASRA